MPPATITRMDGCYSIAPPATIHRHADSQCGGSPGNGGWQLMCRRKIQADASRAAEWLQRFDQFVGCVYGAKHGGPPLFEKATSVWECNLPNLAKVLPREDFATCVHTVYMPACAYPPIHLPRINRTTVASVLQQYIVSVSRKSRNSHELT